MEKRKEERGVIMAVYALFGAWGLLVFTHILFLSGDQYISKQEFASPFLLLPAGLLVLFALNELLRRGRRAADWGGTPVILGLLFLLLQIVLMRLYYFYTGWDVKGIIAAAQQAAYGVPVDAYPFSVYPNNLLLCVLFSHLLRLGYRLGLSQYDAYFLLLVLQSGLCFLAGLLCWRVCFLLTGNRHCALAGQAMYLLLIGLSPWISIPYSDAVGLVFPIAMVCLYLEPIRKSRRNALRWGALGFLAWLGGKIKPTVLIVLIAIVLVELLPPFSEGTLRTLGMKILFLGLGVLACALVVRLACADFGYETDPEKAFGPAHFLAMGLNEQTMGSWSKEDVEYSASFPTARERTEGDLKLARERLSRMGLSGLLRQWKRKILGNYNDGSFSWAKEGGFFDQTLESRNARASAWIRSFYYPDGAHYPLFLNSMQALWLAVLSLAFAASLTKRRKEVSVLFVTLLGSALYGLLFEVRARYAFIFAPLYVALAMLSLRTIREARRKSA